MAEKQRQRHTLKRIPFHSACFVSRSIHSRERAVQFAGIEAFKLKKNPFVCRSVILTLNLVTKKFPVGLVFSLSFLRCNQRNVPLAATRVCNLVKKEGRGHLRNKWLRFVAWKKRLTRSWARTDRLEKN